jgi:EAL domain-containing protein (putative c-di-GMP-specific phosphodiesterase class I)
VTDAPAKRGDDRLLDQLDRELCGWAEPARRLSQAIERNELVLYAQPILDLSGPQRFPIAEVLVRLKAEETALLPPGEFLPAFEYYGMMPALDRWVVAATVRRLAEGSRVPRFSINVSGHTVHDPGFAAFVADRLEQAAVPADSLLFEVDEADVLRNTAGAARFCETVRALGCGVLVDGFAHRAVSFAPLKELRVDFLKVDGRLIRNVASSAMSQRKLAAIVRFGKTLGIGVIAECVEEQAVLAQLRDTGVSYAQGFGVFRPHPIEAIAAP